MGGEMMRVAIAADHGGYILKNELIGKLKEAGYEVVDHGVNVGDSVDYPDYARRVTQSVLSGDAARGVLVCGTGQGMAMSANKVPGIRAAVVADPFSAEMAMAHNDARVLCLGQRVLGKSLAWLCLETWLKSEFEGGRHARRVAKIAG
jgi:ribose 5-phosphate isomerase B